MSKESEDYICSGCCDEELTENKTLLIRYWLNMECKN